MLQHTLRPSTHSYSKQIESVSFPLRYLDAVAIVAPSWIEVDSLERPSKTIYICKTYSAIQALARIGTNMGSPLIKRGNHELNRREDVNHQNIIELMKQPFGCYIAACVYVLALFVLYQCYSHQTRTKSKIPDGLSYLGHEILFFLNSEKAVDMGEAPRQFQAYKRDAF